eukprot:1464921-Amphidinium_carterae.1
MLAYGASPCAGFPHPQDLAPHAVPKCTLQIPSILTDCVLNKNYYKITASGYTVHRYDYSCVPGRKKQREKELMQSRLQIFRIPQDDQVRDQCAELFHCPSLRVYTTSDVIGVEVLCLLRPSSFKCIPFNIADGRFSFYLWPAHMGRALAVHRRGSLKRKKSIHQACFALHSLHLVLSSKGSPEGVEDCLGLWLLLILQLAKVGGALKNVYALAAGAVEGRLPAFDAGKSWRCFCIQQSKT